MTPSFPSKANLKSQAKRLRETLQKRHSIELKHSDCLELLAHVFDLKDWNTLSAVSEKNRPVVRENNSTAEGTDHEPLTAGRLMEALKEFAPDREIQIAQEVLEVGQDSDGTPWLAHFLDVTKEFGLVEDAKAGIALTFWIAENAKRKSIDLRPGDKMSSVGKVGAR